MDGISKIGVHLISIKCMIYEADPDGENPPWNTFSSSEADVLEQLFKIPCTSKSARQQRLARRLLLDHPYGKVLVLYVVL